MHDKVKQIAISEILNPVWGITQQFFSKHEPILIKKVPQIVRIDANREKNTFYVYFPIKDKAYFFVLIVEKVSDKLDIVGVYDESYARAYLYIESERLDPDSVTNLLNINPTEQKNIGSPRHGGIRTYTKNIWIYEVEKDLPNKLERKLDLLLSKIDPISDIIVDLKTDCYISINIVSNSFGGYGSINGYHFNKNLIQKIARLGIELDMDLYVSGPSMDE